MPDGQSPSLLNKETNLNKYTMGTFKEMLLQHPDVEYVTIPSKTDADFQKVLNQWKHDYYFVLLDHHWYRGKDDKLFHGALVARVSREIAYSLIDLEHRLLNS